MDQTTTTEQELTELIDTLDIDSLRAYFTDIMSASVADDPNTEVQEVAA